MMAQRSKTWCVAVVVVVLLGSPTLRAEEKGFNGFLVKTELYLWNRTADFLEILRCGISAGPAFGAELAITEQAQLGAYVAKERGVSFPHFFPPLWLVPYLEDKPVLRTHSGYYRTRAYGPTRYENSPLQEERFHREPQDIRLQVGLLVGQLYANIRTKEVADFAAGVFGADPLGDDEGLDPTARREPMRQLGRGIANLLGSFLEIPLNMIRTNRTRGDFAGASSGLIDGFSRFGTRFAVGAMEIVTFPMGWEPIIEPEYILEPARNTEWRTTAPAFRRRY